MQVVILTAGAARHPFRLDQTSANLDRTFSFRLVATRRLPLRSLGVGVVFRRTQRYTFTTHLWRGPPPTSLNQPSKALP